MCALLIKQCRDGWSKKKLILHINSVFNLLRGSHLLKPDTFIHHRFHWCKHSWNSFIGTAIMCHVAFSWFAIASLKSYSFQVRFDLWGQISQGTRSRVIWALSNQGNVGHCPKLQHKLWALVKTLGCSKMAKFFTLSFSVLLINKGIGRYVIT